MDITAERTTKVLQRLLKPLGFLNFKAIVVKPFSVVIDSIEFGLIPDDETKTIELQPSSTIAFYDSWDGEYDT